MSSPTLELTWQTSFNISNTPVASVESDIDNTFLGIKAALKGFSLNPWTCSGSCDGTTAAMDGVDRLVSIATIVHNGGAHSWVVLKQPATGIEACFDFNGNANEITITWSPTGGYTGGTTTARPTATDQQTLVSATIWNGNVAANTQFRAHILHSSNGKCTRIALCTGGGPKTAMYFETLANPTPGFTSPYCALVKISLDSTSMDYTNYLLDSVAVMRAKGVAAATMDLRMFSETTVHSGQTPIVARFNGANEISSEYPICGVHAWHDETAGQRGLHGYFYDWFFTVPTLANGDTFGSNFAVIGDQVWYTGGTTLQFS